MLYCSGVNGSELRITDTSDGTTEVVTNRDVWNYMKDDIRDTHRVYGCFRWNNAIDATALKPKRVTLDGLKQRIQKLIDVHNKWSGYELADYICFAPIGTKISMKTANTDGRGCPIPGSTMTYIEKIGEDEWHFTQKDNMMDGMTGNADFAAYGIDIAICCGRVLDIRLG